LSIVPGDASIVNKVFAKFISRTSPGARSDIVPPAVPFKERMKHALAKLSEFLGESSIATRDPGSSLSFSGLTVEVYQSQRETLSFYGKDAIRAFSPLRSNGRPFRKYAFDNAVAFVYPNWSLIAPKIFGEEGGALVPRRA
jgi:hypothetical protein